MITFKEMMQALNEQSFKVGDYVRTTVPDFRYAIGNEPGATLKIPKGKGGYIKSIDGDTLDLGTFKVSAKDVEPHTPLSIKKEYDNPPVMKRVTLNQNVTSKPYWTASIRIPEYNKHQFEGVKLAKGTTVEVVGTDGKSFSHAKHDYYKIKNPGKKTFSYIKISITTEV